MSKSVSAIVVSYFTGPSLKLCLYILLNEPNVSEIIVVDNGNPDATRTWLGRFAEQNPKVRLIDGHGNIGFGAGVNLGAGSAGGDYLLVLNPDALIVRGSVSELLSAAEQSQNVGAIGGHLFDIDGKPSRGSRRNAPRWKDVMGLRKWQFHDQPLSEHIVPCEVVSGAFFLISALVFEKIGGFDEEFFLHFEDIDLCVRLETEGYKNLFCPQAFALHYGSTSGVSSRFVKQHKARSFGLYFRRRARGWRDHVLNMLLIPPFQFILRFVR